MTWYISRFRDVITAGVNRRYAGVDAVAERASALRAQYNLTLIDAFQIAVALGADCDAFLTNDKEPGRVSEIKVLVLAELEI